MAILGAMTLLTAGFAGPSPARTLLHAAAAPFSSSASMASFLGRLPVAFEPSAGQAGEGASFVARAHGVQLTLAPTKAVFAAPAPMTKGSGERAGRAVVTLEMLGANEHATVTGSGELPGTVSYILGNDPAGWMTGLQTYGRVTVADAYPGVDVVYHGEGGTLEYDFVVKPNSDPSVIRLAVHGPQRAKLDSHGDLAVPIGASRLVQHKPVAYQLIGGDRRAVPASFTLDPAGNVAFKLGRHDPRATLVIDPSVAYATYYGGSGDDLASAVKVDASGNVYITGKTNSSNFPTVAGSFQTTAGGGQDVFVTKFDAAGTTALWSTYIGGSGDEFQPETMAINASGNVYIASATASANFPVVNPYQATQNSGTQDAFVTELNATGTGLVYSTYLGGSGTEASVGASIAVDSSGNIYVAGNTDSSDYPVTAGVLQSTNAGLRDVFLTKLNPSGAALLYSTYLGGATQETLNSLAIDASGNAYVTGQTTSTAFPTLNALQSVYGGGGDAFVSEINPTATALVFSTFLGGAGGENGRAVGLDAAGRVYVAGQINNVNFPHITAGSFQSIRPGNGEAWVVKLAVGGTPLMYGTYLGGTSADLVPGDASMAVDAAGDAYVVGRTPSGDYPVTPNAVQAVNNGQDVFLTELDPTGAHARFSTFLGGTGTDTANGVTFDAAGNIYVVGQTTGAFPTVNPVQGTYAGGLTDAFVAKITAPRRSPADFDGNGTSDISIFRPGSGTWYVQGGSTTGWGLTGDVPVPGDYDGNGTTEVVIFRDGIWYVNGGATTSWGVAGDIPVPGDYDGNGTTDIAVYRPGSGTWYVLGGATTSWGVSGDIPVPGDYDGDGDTDIAVYRSGIWYVNGGATTSWGVAGDIPVPGDYDGNGTTDIAVYRPAAGTWYVLGGATTSWGGASGDIPVPGDYDGNGTTDVAIFRPAAGTWYVLGGATTNWGGPGDRPLELPEAIQGVFFP